MKKDYLARQSYPTDLTDEQWAVIEPLFVGMREYKYSKREILNAVLYVVDSSCKWRQLPHDLPTWQTVYSFFRRAKISGLWDKMLRHLVGGYLKCSVKINRLPIFLESIQKLNSIFFY